MVTTIKWVSVVYTPAVTKHQLEAMLQVTEPSHVDLEQLWEGYAEYLMEIYGEYHITEKLRQPDDDFINELCYVLLQGAVEPHQLIESYERLTREHLPYLNDVMEQIAQTYGYIKSLEAKWFRLANGKVIPMMMFEGSTLFDLIEGELDYTPILD